MSELKPLIREVLHMDRKQRRLYILVVEGEAEKLDSSGNRRSYLHYGGGEARDTAATGGTGFWSGAIVPEQR